MYTKTCENILLYFQGHLVFSFYLCHAFFFKKPIEILSGIFTSAQNRGCTGLHKILSQSNLEGDPNLSSAIKLSSLFEKPTVCPLFLTGPKS